MPTALSSRRHDDRRLTLLQTAVFLLLIARIRILDMRLAALYGRADRRGQEPHGPTLLRLVRRWLAIHGRIATLLPGVPEPPHVQEARGIIEAMKIQKCPAQGRAS